MDGQGVPKQESKISRIWLGLSISIVVLVTALFLIFVEMRPKISPDFFFGSDDPDMADTQQILAIFPSEEFMILSVDGRNIYTAGYHQDLSRFINRLEELRGFTKIIGLTNGPKSARAAKESPFWRPLIINSDESATLIIAFLPRNSPGTLVSATEEIADIFAEKGALGKIHISGMPYIAEQIRRNIIRDAKLFSTAALLLFALLIWGIYRSPVIALGASISGITAIFLCLSIMHFMAQPVGILTANLAVIVFVLVQSQVIYLTNNWLREKTEPVSAVTNAVLKTIYPSAWCAVTTLLGFITLLFVSAEPLRQLGAGGVIGVFAAFVACFAVFPPFLLLSRAKSRASLKNKQPEFQKSHRHFLRYIGVIVIAAAVVISVPGLFKLNTDPSLLSYFQPSGEIAQGLANIDENGGSSPLQLVVSQKSGTDLDNAEAYKKLWSLHRELEKLSSVGTVLSLPALLAEANNHPMAFLLPWREMVSLLSMDTNQNAVNNFLNSDRDKTLYLLRMKETARTSRRTEIIENIKSIAEKEGFKAEFVGGVYALQGRLSTLVTSSIITGTLSLLAIFLVIAWVVTRKLRLALTMLVCASVIPLISLGGAGWLAVPLDVISAPAVSVAFGLAVDALIHLALAVTRKMKVMSADESWKEALSEQGSGILSASGIICIGFLIFSFSEFPPTTRFGTMIVVGAALAAIAALSVFPVVSGLISRRATNNMDD
ncbi:hypothetical protein A9Q83_07015 [Alphaproteobacteria bacterium 46_93_T64]|nr:hypothetical protein A9Q83_07015 [Alphaproteobacteria bacterium 46_93_T64]